MSDFAGFWIGLALVVSTFMVLAFLDSHAALIWHAPPIQGSCDSKRTYPQFDAARMEWWCKDYDKK